MKNLSSYTKVNIVSPSLPHTRFRGVFPFSYEAGVNMPKAIIEWIKGNKVDTSMLQPEYNRMFSKNDYLMEIIQEIQTNLIEKKNTILYLF